MVVSLGSKRSSFVAIRADDVNKQPRYVRLSIQHLAGVSNFASISSTFSTVSRCVLHILILSITHFVA